MTRKRYLAVVGLLTILVAAGFGVTLMLPPAPGVTKANFDRIENGMSFEEVDELFVEDDPRPNAMRRGWATWRADDGAEASVTFEENGVVSKSWYPSSETILERFRRWLRLDPVKPSVTF